MKIIFATYVDKQDINLMVFSSDQHNANHLAKSNMQSRIIEGIVPKMPKHGMSTK